MVIKTSCKDIMIFKSILYLIFDLLFNFVWQDRQAEICFHSVIMNTKFYTL